MKLLITGASGLLGTRVAQLAQERGHRVYAAYKEHTITWGIPVKLDLTQQEKVLDEIAKLEIDSIIHSAAYTHVDGCETNKDLAWKVNAEGTQKVAKAAAAQGVHLTYISTDYVFDGIKGNYMEEDLPNPVNYYGYTKLKGEHFVKENALAWCIARTSVIYGWGPPHKQNFATWIISSLASNQEISLVTDQFVSPTLNTNLAEMLLEISERKITSILHTAGATRINRYDFALKLAETFNLNMDLIKPTNMDKMLWKAKRPKDSSLNVNRALNLLKHNPFKLTLALRKMKNEYSLC